MKSTEFPQYEFVTPKSFTIGRVVQPRVIVIHTTEGSEGRTSAEAGAAYDARRTDGTSAHFFVDQDTTIQCVHTYNTAHTARKQGNRIGIHIEVCGKAGQTSAQWEDEASKGTMEQLRKLCVALRAKYSWAQLRRLVPNEVRGGASGFCGHVDITYAFPEDRGTHTDPGPNFPWQKLFTRIAELEKPALKLHPKMSSVTPINFSFLSLGDDDKNYDKYNMVIRAQALLKVLIAPDLVIDGVYGKQTAAAVSKLFKTDGTTINVNQWMALYGLER